MNLKVTYYFLNEPYFGVTLFSPRANGIRYDFARLLQLVRHLNFCFSSILTARFALFIDSKYSHS